MWGSARTELSPERLDRMLHSKGANILPEPLRRRVRVRERIPLSRRLVGGAETLPVDRRNYRRLLQCRQARRDPREAERQVTDRTFQDILANRQRRVAPGRRCLPVDLPADVELQQRSTVATY